MGVLDVAGLALTQARHLIGRNVFNSAVADNRNVSSSTPVLPTDPARIWAATSSRRRAITYF